MDVHHVLHDPSGTPPVDRDARWPRLVAALVGGHELPVTPNLAEQLIDMRDTVTRVINNLVVGIDPSTADWRQITDELCVAHLVWCASRRGSSGASPGDQHPAC